MKKNLLVVAGLAVLSTNAFASKARMAALNQDVNGSHYIEDSRSVFKNPAYVNKFKNYVIFELGQKDGSNVSAQGGTKAAPTATAPRAEGGFYQSLDNFNYGLYLGNRKDDDTGSTALRNNSGTNQFLQEDSRLEFTIGGDAGFQWGTTVYASMSEDETLPAGSEIKRDQSSFGLKFGAIMGNIEGYAHLDLMDESKGNIGTTPLAADKYEAGPSWTIGGSYGFGDYKGFLSYKMTAVEATVSSVKTEKETTDLELGVGRNFDIAEKAKLFYDVKLSMETSETKTTITSETKTNTIPLTIGLEAEATSWLTLRASVTQNLWSDVETPNTANAKKKKSVVDSNSVAAGASLTFGKLMIDGTIAQTQVNEGNLRTDDLLSQVGLHYWF